LPHAATCATDARLSHIRRPVRLLHAGSELAGRYAREHCQAEHLCPPLELWHGDRAGEVRDETMLGLADALAAFADGSCPWVEGLVRRAREKGLAVRVIPLPQDSAGKGGTLPAPGLWAEAIHDAVSNNSA
jgi:hypothetical protein